MKSSSNEARMRAMFDNAAIGIVEVDHDDRIIDVNYRICEILGYARDELLGMSVHELTYPDDRAISHDLNEQLHRGDFNLFEYEKRYIKRDGTPLWVHVTVSAIRDENGQHLRSIGTVEDISERKRISEALKESEERFRTLADSMPQLVWTANPDGTVDYYNEKYRDFEGISKDSDKYIWSPVVHPEDIDKTAAAWKTSVEKGTIYEIEHRVKLKHDGYRWFLSRGVPIKNRKGNVVKWYGTATDIHKQKQAEKQKDEFLGVASHELKTPVTSIKAYAQVLQQMFRSKGDIKEAELLVKMDAQINKLTTLIADLLDVTKIQAGKLQFREENFDFNSLVSEVVEEIQRTTPRHMIITNLSDNAALHGDRDRVGQVITNFLTNAAKYSPHMKEIIVSTRHDGDSVTLEVKDFGIGIPPDKLDKVFERFYRVEGQKADTYPGLGLGLYISKEIIKRQGGAIWVESEEGKGSIFCFSLPKKKTKGL